MNLVLTPLLLKSMYPFFIDSTPIEKEGDKESPQTQVQFFTLDITSASLSMAFSMPYNTSVISIDEALLPFFCSTGFAKEISKGNYIFDIYKNKQLTVVFFDLCIQNPLIHFYYILILVVISIMINIHVIYTLLKTF